MKTIYEVSTDFVQVPPEEITVAVASDPTAEGYDSSVYEFSNPRGREKGGGFDKGPMEELAESITKYGLQQPVLARLFGDTPQLIAGERRLQTILRLVQQKTLVYNKHTQEMETADKVYATIPVSLMDDCSDDTALSLAVDENEQSQPLTPKDQVRLVEDLIEVGLSPNEICERLNKNPAWVNHTIHFKDSLPEACFEALMAGEITRHVATSLLKYKEDERQEIWDDARAALTGRQQEKRAELDANVEAAEGNVEVAEAKQELADDLGIDEEDAIQASAEAEEEFEAATDAAAEYEESSMTGGDIAAAGTSTGKKPKTPAAFPKKQIELKYIDPLRAALGIEPGLETDENFKYKDSVTGKIFPRHILQCSLDTSEGIMNQDADVFEVLRELMYELGKWDRPEDAGETDISEEDIPEGYDTPEYDEEAAEEEAAG